MIVKVRYNIFIQESILGFSIVPMFSHKNLRPYEMHPHIFIKRNGSRIFRRPSGRTYTYLTISSVRREPTVIRHDMRSLVHVPVKMMCTTFDNQQRTSDLPFHQQKCIQRPHSVPYYPFFPMVSKNSAVGHCESLSRIGYDISGFRNAK